MRVCIAPFYSGPDQKDGGIRRVVEAQIKYLSEFGWDVTNNPDDADLIACHGATLVERPGVPLVNHSHGLMWEDYAFGDWGDKVNAQLVETMVRAHSITAPSAWVAQAISRGLLHRPEVIYHGVDADEWQTDAPHGGYVLWNKARIDPVSDPRDMQQLARLLPDVPFVSTYGQRAANVQICGVGTYAQMRPVVQRAALYLATARETFGIGTLEALAAGVPVVGWDYGGQHEIVRQGETGVLVEFGDFDALAGAVRSVLAARDGFSRAARDDASERWQWRDKIAQYAALYSRVAQAWQAPRPKVTVIVTSYNLEHFLGEALTSVVEQTMADWECLIVDDCSTDATAQLAARWTEDQTIAKADFTAHADPRFRYIKTPENLGLSGARNFGFAHAKGRYILFLDADDLLERNALDTLATALDRDSGIHIAYGRLDIMAHDGGNRQRNPWPAGPFNWHAQVAHLNQIHGACLLRREVLERSGGYRVRDWRAEDASFWARVTSFGFRAASVTDDTIQIYRLHGDQKSKGEPGDGDWTAWLPWRLAGSPQDGIAAMRSRTQPSPRIVPFGAQGQPPAPLKAWPVRHHQHPVVSIVIPVGPGHAEYLIDALDSVQAQTMPEWECIVVDDVGFIEANEHEVNVIPTMRLPGHPWVQVIASSGSAGAGYARNIGLAAARAPFVVFLDADDILHPRFLEETLRAYDGSGYVYTDWATLAHPRRIDGEVAAHETPDYDRRRMFAQLFHAVTTLLPTQWARDVAGFDEGLKVFEDWDFYAKLAATGYCGVRLAQPLLIYRHQVGLRTRTAVAKVVEGVPQYTPLGDATVAAIQDRFAAYKEERLVMCCGNQAAAVVASDALSDMLMLATGGAAPVVVDTNGPVRLEFVGDQWGAMTYIGKGSGLQYVAGRDPDHRYHNVDPRDVEYFVSTGLFRVVEAEILARAAQPEETAAPPVAVEVRPSKVKGRRAQPA